MPVGSGLPTRRSLPIGRRLATLQLVVVPVELVDESCQLPRAPRLVTIPESSTSCPPFCVASETHDVNVLQSDREPLLSSSPCLCTVVG